MTAGGNAMLLHRRAALALLAAPALARAQSWPDRPIRLLVGFPPGGPTDFIARLVAAGLGAALGQNVVVENRAGANAVVATEAVAHALADGHTLLCAANNHVMNPAVYPRLPYDPIADFAAVGIIATSPSVFYAGAQQPFRSVADVVAVAKARPGQLGYATTGNGGNGHFGGETFRRAADIQITHVPYRGAAPAIQDVVAGLVPLTFGTLVGTIGAYRAGQLRPLAVFGPARAPELPDTPTFAELGLELPDSGVWYGMLAPAAVPADRVQRIAAALEALLRQPEVRQRLATQASIAAFEGPAEFAARLRAELPVWTAVAREAGMKPE